MVIELIGVLETGGPRAAGVPVDPRRTLTVPLGTSLTLRVSVLASDGSQVQLPINSLAWTVKKSPLDTSAAFTKTGPAVAGAVCDFSLLPADTKNLSPGKYVFDVWYVVAGVRNAVVPLSPFELEYAATLP
jgi:hypothetical protein